MYIIKIILIAIVLLLLVLAAALALWYLTRDKLQRQYLKGIIKQIPHLPGRYSV